ncbi:MAG: hypothetical protein DRQ63_00100 [Gammaproteobacteria bacterium]|nr:MAG: hypothetical protein DRQ63_00100 [Gammaproteobacteria bacterium]
MFKSVNDQIARAIYIKSSELRWSDPGSIISITYWGPTPISGQYPSDDELTEKAMRPSETLNAIIDSIN